MGKAQFIDASLTKEVSHDKEAKTTHRLTEEDGRMEAARSTALEGKRFMTPIFSPDLHAMFVGSDAERRAHGLLAHSMESFLRHLHMQVNSPHAAHHNEAPHEPMEHEFHRIPNRSQAAPLERHCQESRQ